MAISNNTPRNTIVANGSASQSYSFEIFDEADIQVFVEGVLKTLTTHYTVAGVGGTNGGTVTFTSGNIPTSGQSIVFLRRVESVRTTDYAQQGDFDSDVVNSDFDRLWSKVQELEDTNTRSIRFADTSTTSASEVFPDPVSDNVIGWNSAGNALENKGSISDINTLAGIASDIQTVAGIDSDVTTVASNSSDISTVSDNIADVNTVADNLGTIASKQNDVVTTRGDLVIGDASGDADRLAVGTAGQVLSSDGTDAAWASGFAQLSTDQTWTGSQRSPFVTDNDGSFDMDEGQNFKCTPSGNITVEFTNEADGQSGWIVLDNTGGHTISWGAEVILPGGDLALGTAQHLLSYICDGTSVYMTGATEVS